MRKAIGLLCLAISLTPLFGIGALEYQARTAYLQIDQVGDTSYVVLWKVPKTQGTRVSIRPVFSNDFIIEATGAPKQVTGAVLYHYTLHGPIPLAGQTLAIDGLE